MALGIFFMVLLASAPTVINLVQQYSLSKAGLPEIDRMSGLQFEKYLQILFRRHGYAVERTPYVGDYGADLVISKNGERCLVQAKRWSKPVGIRAVQEAVAAKAKYDCERAMVVTNRHFTKSAIELARVNQVSLIDRKQLATGCSD